ncbi:hypothetical protein, partial [Mesorhizobium sp. M7A.F.Ca.AU.002.02.1.1]|uniref:hypothetical protein n=1 Tax=Mesorhizobium sp. M7A.F.Ca.AU.002.02.1.1 TaxID=2496671 RepID=UPI0019CFE8AE
DMVPPWVSTLVITLPTRRWRIGHALLVHRTSDKKQHVANAAHCTFGHGRPQTCGAGGPIAKPPIEGNNVGRRPRARSI